MPVESNITQISGEIIGAEAAVEISSAALRIKYLKREIEKSLVRNHDCSEDQLKFLLQRL